LFVICPRRAAWFARAEAAIEEPALYRVARQCERCSEVLARGVVPPTAKFELADRRGMERVCGKAIAIGDQAHLFEPPLGTLGLCDRNGPVECHYRGRTHGHQMCRTVKRCLLPCQGRV